ncbi:MAG: right-handed parallel beta-helix repeat-containing protein [Halobacteriales archaeon]|nr:right-handed parallel beta-helix repeat-containing protein [Halobacteriales archaeon]
MAAGLAEAATQVPAAPEGRVTTDTTWTLEGSPYIVTATSATFFHGDNVHPGPNLIIEPGVVVEFTQGTSLLCGAGASIHAVGTAQSPILFTSAATTKHAGDWGRIEESFEATPCTMHFENVTIEYAGDHGNNPAVQGPPAINDNDAADFVLKNSVVRHNGGRGVSLVGPIGAVPVIEGSEIYDNSLDGISFPGGTSYEIRGNYVHDNGGVGIVALGRGGAVTGNVLARNQLPLRMTTGAHPLDNVYDGNARNEIEVVEVSFLQGSTLWQRNLDSSGALIVYHVTTSFQIPDGTSLTIEPGNVLKFAGGSLLVAGGLDARGTAESPILWTSDKASPQPGDWSYVFIFSTANAQMANFTIEYAGAAGVSLVTDAPLDIADCTIRFGAGTGLDIRERFTMRNCDVHHHAQHGLLTQSATGIVDVRDSSIHDNGGTGILTSAPGGHFERNAIARNALPVHMNPNTDLARSNTFDGNTLNEIQVGSNPDRVYGSRSWPRFADASTGAVLPYHVVHASEGVVEVFGSLTIEPGNIITFQGTGFIAVGGLSAVGTAEHPILFTSDRLEKAPGQWRGITVSNGVSEPLTRLENVTLEYAGGDAAVYAFRSSALLRNCVLQHNTRGVYNIDGQYNGASALVRVEGCTIRDNHEGLRIEAGPTLLRGNRIVGNDVGVFANGGPPSLRADNNVFDNAVNALDTAGNSYFVPKAPAPGGNIIGNPFFGGNAWSDYQGEDCDGDGLGDTLLPYRTQGSGVDFHPLVAIGHDIVPPVSTSALDGTLGKAGWWRSAVAVTLNATDDLCGVRGIHYRIDGGDPRTYNGTFNIEGDGVHTLAFWAEDRADNVEAAHLVQARIDTTPPTVRITDPLRGNVYVNDIGLPLVVRDACPGTPAAAACAGVPFDVLARDCPQVVPAATCPLLPFDGVFPVTVLLGTKTLGAEARDATSGVVTVTFRVDARTIGEDTAAPFNVAWDTTHEALARHEVVAVAEDAAGNRAVSVPERPITVPLDAAVLLQGVRGIADGVQPAEVCRGLAALGHLPSERCGALAAPPLLRSPVDGAPPPLLGPEAASGAASFAGTASPRGRAA